MRFIFTLFFVSITFSLFAQKKEDLVYQPVQDVNFEEIMPSAAAILVEGFKIGIDDFDYAGKTLTSTWYEYYGRGLLGGRKRAKIKFSIDEAKNLHVDFFNIQSYSSENGWFNSSEGSLIYGKKKSKEYQIRAIIADGLKKTLEEPKVLEINREWFFKNPVITRIFFNKATEVAGERWFNEYLKDQEVTWNLTFVDIENNDSASGYKYKEKYFTGDFNPLSIESEFHIVKYTNNDEHVFLDKNTVIQVKGYVKTLHYNQVSNSFFITLMDELDSEVPSVKNTVSEENTKSDSKSILEVADKLKKLKELLDLGAITKDEYDEEKRKLLN